MVVRIKPIFLVFLLILTFNVSGLLLKNIKIENKPVFTKIKIASPDKIYFAGVNGLYVYDRVSLKKVSDSIILDFVIWKNSLVYSSIDGIFIASPTGISKITDNYGFGIEIYNNYVYFFNEKGLFFTDLDGKEHQIDNFRSKFINKIKVISDILYVSEREGVFELTEKSIKKSEVFSFDVLDFFELNDSFILWNGSDLIKKNQSEEKKFNLAPYFPVSLIKADDVIFILCKDRIFLFDGSGIYPFLENEFENLPVRTSFHVFDVINYGEKQFMFFIDYLGNIYEYERYIDEDKDRFFTNLALAVDFFNKGNFDESLKIFNILYDIAPDNFELNRYMGKIFRQQNNFEKAHEHFSKAFEINKTAELYTEFASIHILKGRRDFAHFLLLEARKKDFFSLNSHISVVENLNQQKKYTLSEFYIEEALKQFGEIAVLVDLKIKTLNLQRKYAELEIYFDYLLRKYPQTSSYYVVFSDYLIERMKYKRALEILDLALNRAESYNHDVFPLMLRKGYVITDMKNFKEAEDLIKTIVFKWPENEEVFLLAAYHSFRINRYELALTYISSSIRLGINPEHWRILYMRGFIAYSEMKYLEGIALFEASIQANPFYPYSRYYASDIYIMQRAFFSAAREFRIIIDYWPDFEFIQTVISRYKALE